jgi:catechol 2,3-dioxygenase-like lactoylglutathione lyase family enzyme
MRKTLLWTALPIISIGIAATAAWSQEKKMNASPHSIGSAKLIVSDLKKTQAFYEQMFGMKEVAHYNSPTYDEPIMGFSSGARLALFTPTNAPELKKSQFPVALIYTPEFDAVVKRIEDAKYPIDKLPSAQSSSFRIAIARDPSGNAIEIFARDGKPYEVGGSKLIVDDRQKAEDFFVRILGAKAGQRYQTPTYDEVIMNVGDGAFLALFQPKNEAPLPKSPSPVVAIYTSEFDAVLKRVTEAGLGYREVKSTQLNAHIIVAKDPAGNSVEIISR